MKRKVWVVLTLVVMFLTVFSGLSSASETFTIKVQATGDVRVTPTKVQMWIGAQTDGPSAEQTLAKSSEATQKLIGVFSEFTSPELVKTSDFNMYQRERWDETTRQSIAEGFTFRHVFEVQILDLSKVAAFLDAATTAGANVIYGLQYGVQDYRTPQEEAFKKAMEEAWWKAGLLVNANQASNLSLESVEETYFYGAEYGAGGSGVVTESADLFMPGQLKVSVTILATFRAELPTVVE